MIAPRTRILPGDQFTSTWLRLTADAAPRAAGIELLRCIDELVTRLTAGPGHTVMVKTVVESPDGEMIGHAAVKVTLPEHYNAMLAIETAGASAVLGCLDCLAQLTETACELDRLEVSKALRGDAQQKLGIRLVASNAAASSLACAARAAREGLLAQGHDTRAQLPVALGAGLARADGSVVHCEHLQQASERALVAGDFPLLHHMS